MRYLSDYHVLPIFWPLKVSILHKRKIPSKYQNATSYFLSHTSKLDQQKQLDVVLKITAKIYPSNKYNIFPVILLLTNHETPYNLNIVLSFQPPFEPITAPFTITGQCVT